MAEALPIVISDALVELGGHDMKCLTNHIELTPDVTIETATTMCGVADYPGAVKWQFIATFYQSFDEDGTDAVLYELVQAGDPVEFRIVPKGGAAVSATNPEYSGMVIPQPYSYINADAGALSTVDITWTVQGEPERSTTGAASRASAEIPAA
jgi:hypothetical protein